MGSNSVSIKVIISKATRVSSGAVYLPMSNDAMAPRYAPESGAVAPTNTYEGTWIKYSEPISLETKTWIKYVEKTIARPTGVGTYQSGYSGPRY